MGTGTAELSALWMLSYVSSAGSFDALIDVEGGAQQDRFVGGSQLISQRLAAELGDDVAFSARRCAGSPRTAAGSRSKPTASRSRAQRVIVDRRRRRSRRGSRSPPRSAVDATSSPSGWRTGR